MNATIGRKDTLPRLLIPVLLIAASLATVIGQEATLSSKKAVARRKNFTKWMAQRTDRKTDDPSAFIAQIRDLVETSR
jgi:hypothetical protein